MMGGIFRRIAARKYRYLVSSSLALVIAAVPFGLWSRGLFRQLELVARHRTLQHPALLFSDISTLRPWMPLTADEFVRQLEDRGYAPRGDRPLKAGRYDRPRGDIVEVFFREFHFPDGRSTSGAYRFTFRESQLVSITILSGGGEVDSVLFEPVPLGDLSRDGIEYRPWIALDEIPESLKQSVITAEDVRFYRHLGVDPQALLRALTINVTRKGIYQGGSTLTQQLVKNAFLTKKRTFGRKITEALLAVAMEFRYDKSQIFEMYLNQIYLGQNGGRAIYGVDEASRVYFGKHVSELTLGESALLAGIIPAPASNSPKTAPRRALARRNLVLDLLLRYGRISRQEWARARQERIALVSSYSRNMGGYYTQVVREQLAREFKDAIDETQGYRIYTALEPYLQENAEKAVAAEPTEGALVALDPKTGYVKALVGGRDVVMAPYNRAVAARRQPGSAFKPLVYAAALESRAVTLATQVVDEPFEAVSGGEWWAPQNYDGDFAGTMTVREAIVHSRNIPVVKVIERIGPGMVARLGRSLGIQTPLHPVLSLALGTSEVTPLQMTAAYAAFANGGYAVKPVFITYIVDADGEVVKRCEPERHRVFSEGTAALITSVLEDVVDHGTGYTVRELGFTAPVAGKTGTTDECNDAWFIGYSPGILCGVWIGNDLPKPLGGLSSHIAIPVWVKFMRAARRQFRAESFPGSAELTEVIIDPATGLRAGPSCPQARPELFLHGTEPAGFCPAHGNGHLLKGKPVPRRK